MTMYELTIAVYGMYIPEIDDMEYYEVPEESFLSIVNLEDGE